MMMMRLITVMIIRSRRKMKRRRRRKGMVEDRSTPSFDLELFFPFVGGVSKTQTFGEYVHRNWNFIFYPPLGNCTHRLESVSGSHF